MSYGPKKTLSIKSILMRTALRPRDAISALIFKRILEYVLRKVPENAEGITMKGIVKMLVDADDLGIWVNQETIIANAKRIVEPGKEVGLEVIEEKNQIYDHL